MTLAAPGRRLLDECGTLAVILGRRGPGQTTPAAARAGEAEEVDDGHQHRSRPDDERRDRRALSPAHILLLVGPGRDRSDRHRPGRRRLPLHARRQADPRLQQPADVGQHRPRRPPRDRRDHRAGDQAPVRPARLRHGAAGTPRGEARRDPAGRSRQGLPDPRRRRSDRERDQARPRVHRPPQDPRPLPRVPRRDARGDDADRRSAALGERARDRRRRPLPGHPPLGREGAAAGRREPPGPRGRHPVRGRPHDCSGVPRDDRRDERHPHPARRLHPGRPRDLHPQRHPHGRRRGHGRLRTDGALVRDRQLGHRAGPHDDGQGARRARTCRSARWR